MYSQLSADAFCCPGGQTCLKDLDHRDRELSFTCVVVSINVFAHSSADEFVLLCFFFLHPTPTPPPPGHSVKVWQCKHVRKDGAEPFRNGACRACFNASQKSKAGITVGNKFFFGIFLDFSRRRRRGRCVFLSYSFGTLSLIHI